MIGNSVLNILIVRHGQTDHNLAKILQGHTNTDLNSSGINEAKLAGKRLKNDKIELDAVWSSDLNRCRQTLEHILSEAGQGDLKPVFLSDFRERYMGDLENMSVVDARLKADREGKSFHDYGESKKAAVQRLNRAFDGVVDESLKKNHSNILILSHGGVISKFISHLLERGFVFSDKVKDDDIRVPHNTSFTKVVVDRATRGGVIESFGDASHLGANLRQVSQAEQ